MTFCFAWKNKNDISIIADSLITLNKDSKITKTSFDENITGCRVVERDSKLCVIRNTIISYSGDVGGGLSDILWHYEKYSEDNIDEIENLKNAVESEIRVGEIIEFLLAYVDKNKKSCLYKLKFEGIRTVYEELISEFAYIGNQEYGGLDKVKQIYDIIRKKTDLGMLDERIWILTSLQYYGINSPQIKNGIGGIFKTISLVNGEIKWNDNIKYNIGIFSDNTFETKKQIELISFKNHIYVKSDYLENSIILTNCMKYAPIIPSIRQITYDFHIFRNTSNRNVLIIPQDKYDYETKEKYMNQLRNGKNDKGISEVEQTGIVLEKEYYSFFYFVSQRYSKLNI